MAEEEGQKNITQKVGDKLKKGAKNAAKEAVKKVIKKILAVLAPILLKLFIIIIIAIIIAQLISWLIEKIRKDQAEEMEETAIVYDYTEIEEDDIIGGSEESETEESAEDENVKGFRIKVKPDVRNKGYTLNYSFLDENGHEIDVNRVIEETKEKLESVELDSSDFTESELKMIAAFEYNGMNLADYTEDELKCYALFEKAQIAGENFDLRPVNDIGKTPDINEIRASDTIYGTLRVKKVSSSDGGSSERYLEFLEYETFKSYIDNKNKNVSNYFSINKSGNLVCGKSSSSTTEVSYLDEGGTELTDAQIAMIPEEHQREAEPRTVVDGGKPINYKNYISKFVLKYIVLNDLLITTQNTKFCNELTALAFTGHIDFVILDELSVSHSKTEIVYTDTKVTCDYVDYNVTGSKEVPVPASEGMQETGTATTRQDIKPKKDLGWYSLGVYNREPNSSNDVLDEWTWVYNNKTYKMRYFASKKWHLLSYTPPSTRTDSCQTQSVDDELIVTGTLDEFGDYTKIETFTYQVVTESNGEGHNYKYAVGEIDTWFAKYERFKNGYGTIEPKVFPGQDREPDITTGEFKEDTTENIRNTQEIKTRMTAEGFDDFYEQKENAYKQATGADDATCTITELTITDWKKEDYSTKAISSFTKYVFTEEDESEVDLTEIDFKNINIIDNKAVFTNEDTDGFLYLFDKYSDREDMFLEHDAETKLFVLLEESKGGQVYAYLLKALLSAYDGVDRGVSFDQLKLLFKVRQIILNGSLSPYGCKLDREEFIEKARAHDGRNNSDGEINLDEEENLLVRYAGEIYDISRKYNVNPCLTYAWAWVESSGGTSYQATRNHNLFGLGVGNTGGGNTDYGTYENNIERFCEFVSQLGTEGTDPYMYAAERGEAFATVNDVFDGPPEKNIYTLFCTYAYLGDTHICNDPSIEDTSIIEDPARFKQYCKDHDSNWGTGGRYIIYSMYQIGTLYKGEYLLRCGHLSGSDPTTLTEQADYVQYTVDERIQTAKARFGNGCFVGSYGIVEAAYEVANHYLEGQVYYGGNYLNERDPHGLHTGTGSVQRTWDIIENNELASYGIVCATFVSLALWKAEIVEASWLETHSWHATSIGHQLLELPGWVCAGFGLDEGELEEGDVIVYPGNEHIIIYVGNGCYIDQNYCCWRWKDDTPPWQSLGNLTLDITGNVYRYCLE